MTTHSKLSPSARHRWGVCPQAPRQEAKYPDQPSGPAAIDGTHSHTLLEAMLLGNLVAAGSTLSDHEGSFVVDQDRIDRVMVAVEYVHRRRDELGESCVVHTERKIDPGPLFGRNDMAGTSDVILISDDVIEVIDYKDGMAYVEAKDNPQMEQYAWGVIAELSAGGKEVKQSQIVMTIVQPKVAEKGLPPISSYTVPMVEFIKGRQRLLDQTLATDDPDAPFVPGESQCKYCKHKGACSALTTHTMVASGITFENLDIAKQAANQDPHTLTDRQLRELVEAAPLLRQLIEAAEAEALRRFEQGGGIEGLKVVRGRGSRSWLFSEEEIAEKLKKMGIPKDHIWKTSLISPAQAEKLVWEKRDGTKKQLSERQLALINNELSTDELSLDELIKKSDGKLTVVSCSDDRPAVQLNAASMFAAVDALPAWLA